MAGDQIWEMTVEKSCKYCRYMDLWSVYSSCLKNFLSIVRFFFLCAGFHFSGSYSKIYQQRRHLNNGSRTSSFNGTGDMSDYARGMIIILHFSKDEFYSKQQARTLFDKLDELSCQLAL